MFWGRKKKLRITNKESRKKKTNKKKTGGSPSLLSSFWVLVIPLLFIPCQALAPTPRVFRNAPQRLREGWQVACVGMEGGIGSRVERKRLVNQPRPPLDSANHQSRCWWRFRLRTERTSAVNLEKSEARGTVLAIKVAVK